MVGYELELEPDGDWVHASERSAAIAWSTNLPAWTRVEYGLTPGFGLRTETQVEHHQSLLQELGGDA